MSPARVSLIVRSIVVATVVLGAGLLLFSLWFGQGQQRTAEGHRATEAQQQSAQSVPSVVPSPHTGQTGNEGQQKHSHTTELSDPMVLLTALLLFVNAVVAGVYVYQLRQMRNAVVIASVQRDTMLWQFNAMKEQVGYTQRQLDEMLQQTAISRTVANAAEISARAAEQSARVAAQSFEISMRPDLFIKSATLHNFQVMQPAKLKLVLYNGGEIAAYNFGIEISGAFRNAPFEGVLIYRPPRAEAAEPIPAGVERSVNTVINPNLTPQLFERVQNGSLQFFIYGVFWYEDRAGRQYTEPYCRVYTPDFPDELSECPSAVRNRMQPAK